MSERLKNYNGSIKASLVLAFFLELTSKGRVEFVKKFNRIRMHPLGVFLFIPYQRIEMP